MKSIGGGPRKCIFEIKSVFVYVGMTVISALENSLENWASVKIGCMCCLAQRAHLGVW